MGNMKLSVDHLGNTFKSLTEMCTYWGIDKSTFVHRIRLNWDLKDALETKSHKQTITDHKGNEFKSFLLMSAFYNKSPDTVKYRLKQRWSLEEALEKPVSNDKITNQFSYKDHNGIEYPSKSRMCAAYNISKSLFDYRIHKGLSLKDALTTPVKYRNNKISSDDTMGDNKLLA